MKKSLLFIIINIFFLQTSYASSTKYGYGDLNLSDFVVDNFIRYVKGGHSEAPYLFAVSADGKQFNYYVCPAGLNNCGGGDERILEECDSYSRKNGGSGNCKIFARLRTIKWDNGSSRNKKIKSKWSNAEIREKLKEYNLYGSLASKPKDSKKMSDQLEKLNSLYKSGAITEAEFKKAKNRILNN
jgi:hypothetical protein